MTAASTAPTPSGIAAVDARWGGLRPGTAVLLVGRAGAGRTALALTAVRTAVEAGQTCLLLSPRAPEALTVAAGAAGIDLAALHKTGRLRVLRIPSAQDLAAKGNAGLDAAYRDLGGLATKAGAERVVIEDFTPLVQYTTFEAFGDAFDGLRSTLAETGAAFLLGLGEPANDPSRKLLDVVQSRVEATLRIAAGDPDPIVTMDVTEEEAAPETEAEPDPAAFQTPEAVTVAAPEPVEEPEPVAAPEPLKPEPFGEPEPLEAPSLWPRPSRQRRTRRLARSPTCPRRAGEADPFATEAFEPEPTRAGHPSVFRAGAGRAVRRRANPPSKTTGSAATAPPSRSTSPQAPQVSLPTGRPLRRRRARASLQHPPRTGRARFAARRRLAGALDRPLRPRPRQRVLRGRLPRGLQGGHDDSHAVPPGPFRAAGGASGVSSDGAGADARGDSPRCRRSRRSQPSRRRSTPADEAAGARAALEAAYAARAQGTPFLVVAARMEPSQPESASFGTVVEGLRAALPPAGTLYADSVRLRSLLILPGSDANAATHLFAALQQHLQQHLGPQAEATLRAVAAITVPDGQPFGSAQELWAYAVES